MHVARSSLSVLICATSPIYRVSISVIPRILYIGQLRPDILGTTVSACVPETSGHSLIYAAVGRTDRLINSEIWRSLYGNFNVFPWILVIYVLNIYLTLWNLRRCFLNTHFTIRETCILSTDWKLEKLWIFTNTYLP